MLFKCCLKVSYLSNLPNNKYCFWLNKVFQGNLYLLNYSICINLTFYMKNCLLLHWYICIGEHCKTLLKRCLVLTNSSIIL